MTDQTSVSVIHLMDNKSQIADIKTWRKSSDHPNLQWRGELRFKTENPNSPIGFSIHIQSNSQEEIVRILMNVYQSFSQFMEIQYANALARMSQHVEAINEDKQFTPAKFHAQIITRAAGTEWTSDLRFNDSANMSIQFVGENKDDVLQRANICYRDMLSYMNTCFVQRLTRLSKFLATDLSNTLVIWN